MAADIYSKQRKVPKEKILPWKVYTDHDFILNAPVKARKSKLSSV